VADEVVLREPTEALLVDREVGQRGGRVAGPEQRPQRLSLVDAEGGDVDDAGDVRRIGAERGDDLAAVGMAGDDRRPVLAGEDLAQAGDASSRVTSASRPISSVVSAISAADWTIGSAVSSCRVDPATPGPPRRASPNRRFVG
jgi:hypothetical protein